MQDRSLHIAVVGGGIGGLTTALALQHVGLEVDVFEQAPHFSEVGAGVGIGPNALRLLQHLGLEEQLAQISTPFSAFLLRRWSDGEVLSATDTAQGQTLDNGNPFHRAELLKVLMDALPSTCMHAGKHCVHVEQADRKIGLEFEDGSSFTADVLVGADGIHSSIRNQFHTDKPVFSEQIAYRGLIPMERLTFLGEERKRASLWMGPQRHFLIYPISKGRLMNLVAFVPTKDSWRVESWSAQGDVHELAHEFDGWDERIGRTIQQLDQTMRWALFDREPLDHWSNGQITLLGDAAHAMLPHRGQGAGQSIEDAIILSHCLQEARPDTINEWLQFYEHMRSPRTTQIQQATRAAGRLYDLPDNETYQRDNHALLADNMTWIWDYDADRAFTEALHQGER